MIENLPGYINVLFIITTLATVIIFYKAADNSAVILWTLIIWLVVQGLISLSGFYNITQTIPPRFLLAVFPPFLLIVILFISKSGKMFLNSLDIKTIIYLQTMRVPVEIVLYLLSIYKLVPELMTFEGRNLDIIAGFTAPFVAYFGFTKKLLSRNVILIWNIICFGLLLNILVNAVLSAPFSFQKFAFDQPNRAVFYFPYIWLPCFIVPAAFLSHLLIFMRIKEF